MLDISSNEKIDKLKKNYFHVVIRNLFLEYRRLDHPLHYTFGDFLKHHRGFSDEETDDIRLLWSIGEFENSL